MTGVMRKPAFWVAYAIAALLALGIAARLFPLAIPIVNLDVKVSRTEAIASARALATKLHIAPAGARVAARFAHDGTTQNYVELEGGGKAAFAELTRGDRYSPYWWEVRLFTLGAIEETIIRLSPDGAPAGFARRLPETYVRDAARKALDAASARTIAETRARDDWGIDLAPYRLLEQSQQTQLSGRVDHSFAYERPEPLGDARIRLRLTVAGDELTGVAPFVHIPEAFDRRYEELRSANNLIANLATVSAGLLYGIGGCILAVLWLARKHWLLWRPPIAAGLVVGSLLACASLASSGRVVRRGHDGNRHDVLVEAGRRCAADRHRAAVSPTRSCSWRPKASRGARSRISRNCGGCGRATPRLRRRSRVARSAATCSCRSSSRSSRVLLRDQSLARLVAAVGGADRSRTSSARPCPR